MVSSRPRTGLRSAFQLILLVCACLPLPMAIAQHYPILAVPGSPKNITTLFQDSTGRMWVGTPEGLFCFDGVRFYSMQAVGFPKEQVQSLAEDDQGGLWAVTDGGLQYGMDGHGGVYRYADGRVTKMFSHGGEVLAYLAPGAVLVNVQMGPGLSKQDLYVFRRRAESWKAQLLVPQGPFSTSVSVHGDGNALFGCDGGWCELTRQQILDWPSRGTEFQRHAIPGLVDRLSRIVRDRFGCVWARTGSGGWFGCGADGKLTRLPASFTPMNDYGVLREAPDGKMLSLGMSSLVFGRPGSFHRAGPENGVPDQLSTALVSQDGTIWLGSASGLYRFSNPFQMEFWSQNDGVEYPNALLHAGGRMLLGSAGIEALDAGRSRWQTIPRTEDLGDVLALSKAKDGTVYAAATGQGLTQLTPEGEVLASSTNEHRGLSLAQDTEGTMWFGGKGIFRARKRAGALELEPQGLGGDSVMAMQANPQRKRLWVCNWQELLLRSGGKWQHLGVQNGLSALRDHFCQTLAVHPDGDVWISYAGMPEFSQIKLDTQGHIGVQNYRSGGGIGDAHNAFLGVDSRGWVWRGSDAEYVATKLEAEAGAWLRIDSLDGIPMSGGNANAFFGDTDGSVWFGGGNMVVHFSPAADFITKFPAPKVFVSGFSAGSSAPSFAGALQKLPHGEDLTAHIGSLQFDRRHALRLRWRLLPEQSAWQSCSDLDLHLGRLHWGAHQLQVQAQMGVGPVAGAWSNVAEQSFEVLLPAALRWPVLYELMAGAAALAFAVAKWRKKLKARAEKRLPELAEWRMEALSSELHKLEGTRLDGRFAVGELIARGGFASVLRGLDLSFNNRSCAIKIFRQELLDKDWMERRFQQEVAALERIRHPSVVEIYGSGRLPSGAFYLVMEFIDGQTLRELLESGRLAMQQTSTYLLELGSALRAIHEQDICHRDLKPENVMLRNPSIPGNELVLIDFSIAIVKDADESLYGLSRAAGTFYYMAPEQAIGFADCSTDIYSLAKILIEMLTGQRLSTLLPDASMDLPDRVRGLLRALSLPLSEQSIETIAQALEFDPSRRPKDAYAFATQIADDLNRL